jgi:ribonuclease HI
VVARTASRTYVFGLNANWNDDWNGNGWNVNVNRFDNDNRWNAGNRFFSRNYFFLPLHSGSFHEPSLCV